MAVSIEICQLWSHPHHHYPDKQGLTRLNQRDLNSQAKAWLWTALQKYSEANKSLYSTRHPESKMSNIKVKVSLAFVRLILRKTRSLYFLFAFSDPCGKNTRRAAGRRDCTCHPVCHLARKLIPVGMWWQRSCKWVCRGDRSSGFYDCWEFELRELDPLFLYGVRTKFTDFVFSTEKNVIVRDALPRPPISCPPWCSYFPYPPTEPDWTRLIPQEGRWIEVTRMTMPIHGQFAGPTRLAKIYPRCTWGAVWSNP